MNLKKTVKLALAAAALTLMTVSAEATTIDFGTSWLAWTGAGVGNYASAPFNRVLGIENGTHSNETAIASFLDLIAGTSFVAADIHKTDYPPELGGSNGYFSVNSGWNYLVVQYDGPNGGSAVIKLDGNAASVPYDSSVLWGAGDQYAVSHFSVAGPSTPDPGPGPSVPDGGTTAAMLGCALGVIGVLRKKLSSPGQDQK